MNSLALALPLLFFPFLSLSFAFSPFLRFLFLFQSRGSFRSGTSGHDVVRSLRLWVNSLFLVTTKWRYKGSGPLVIRSLFGLLGKTCCGRVIRDYWVRFLQAFTAKKPWLVHNFSETQDSWKTWIWIKKILHASNETTQQVSIFK